MILVKWIDLGQGPLNNTNGVSEGRLSHRTWDDKDKQRWGLYDCRSSHSRNGLPRTKIKDEREQGLGAKRLWTLVLDSVPERR